MKDTEIESRLKVVERLTRLFRLERMVHLGVTVISLIMLLASAGVLIYEKKAGAVELSLMFGASGLITYSAGRLLFMWSQALKVIMTEKGGEKND